MVPHVGQALAHLYFMDESIPLLRKGTLFRGAVVRDLRNLLLRVCVFLLLWF